MVSAERTLEEELAGLLAEQHLAGTTRAHLLATRFSGAAERLGRLVEAGQLREENVLDSLLSAALEIGADQGTPTRRRGRVTREGLMVDLDRGRKIMQGTQQPVLSEGPDVANTPSTNTRRPTVEIDTDEYRVVEESIEALGADPAVFQRGGLLVRVRRDESPNDRIQRATGAPTIQALPPANLRERLTRCASFVKINAKGEPVPAHPAGWLVSAVDARAEWPGIRHLLGISDTPVLRPDGTVWQQEGYDAETGVLYEPDTTFPQVHPDANIDDAVAALDELLEVVCDFRFEAPEHRSAWLAGLLTPLARFAFEGPAPLFLIDANVRGAGKGLLAQTIGRIVLGREVPVSGYAPDPEEMRKRITAIAIAGDRMVLLDNVEGTFGNDALDRALTSTRWKDRILGRSEEIDLPLLPTWLATGNNVAVAGDTARRIIHCRLDVLEERPEQRNDFRHPHLLDWIQEHRPRLVWAALTILSAYLRRGRADQSLNPYGSFEGWSAIVRQAVVWAGLPDPCRTRERLAESADTATDTLAQLLEAWKRYDPTNHGLRIAEMLRELYPETRTLAASEPSADAMRAALDALIGGKIGNPPTAKQVGVKLAGYRRRVINGHFIDVDEARGRKNGRIWHLFATEGDNGDNSDRLPSG